MNDRCRCGRIKDMGGEGFLQINDVVHTSVDIGGYRAFCGSRRNHDIAEKDAEIDRLREELAEVRAGWKQTIQKLTEALNRAEAAEAREAKLRTVVEAVEWHEDGGFIAWRCPWCGEDRKHGHAADCARQHSLGGGSDDI
ncbi:MAG: hypothetical protein P1P84_02805 [Deferrisomatales bacterium]|nr:hypothetical protein [Deferrisomatales bacterium]